MKRRHPAQLDARTPAPSSPGSMAPNAEPAQEPIGRSPARSREEAEARYVVARNAWTAAMRSANSGRPADLASLALAQEAYEAAVAEREGWIDGRVKRPVDHEEPSRKLEVAVGQELAWRKIHQPPPPAPGLVGRLRRRFGRK